MQPILLSQRDPKWKDIKLGTSKTTTIGSYGCTITCIAMKYGVTPDFLNERLKAVNGYLAENLVIWKKVEEALPGAKFTWKYGEYDNEAAKANLPCIVEVSGALIGGDRHWVLFVGNKQLYDPWDGQIKPTNTYGMPISLVVLEGEYKAPEVKKEDEKMYKGLDLTNKDSMKVVINVWERLQKGELIEKKRYEEMTLAAQKAAKEQRTGVLSIDDATKLREELEAIVKAAGVISSWGQQTLTLLNKNTSQPVKKASEAAEENGTDWLSKIITGIKEGVKK